MHPEDAIQQAREVIQQARESGRPADAQSAIREIDSIVKFLTNPKDTAGLLLEKATFLGILRKFEDAKTQLKIAREEAPDDEETNLAFEHGYACMCHQQEQFEEAYERNTALLKKYSRRLAKKEWRFLYEDVQQYRAFELVQLLRFDEAVPILEEVVTFEMKTDDRNTAVANLGICYSRLGIYEEAIELLVKSLELGLTIDWEGQAHCQLGIAYVHLSRLDEAKKELQFCEENAAKYQLPLSVVYGWLYRVCRGLGQTEEAEHYHRLGKPV